MVVEGGVGVATIVEDDPQVVVQVGGDAPDGLGQLGQRLQEEALRVVEPPAIPGDPPAVLETARAPLRPPAFVSEIL
jgi:hypothetical protein